MVKWEMLSGRAIFRGIKSGLWLLGAAFAAFLHTFGYWDDFMAFNTALLGFAEQHLIATVLVVILLLYSVIKQ
jgi:hypothetical protein